MLVRWTSLALRHIEDIEDYIALDSPMAAYRLIVDLVQRTDQGLAATPEMGRTGRARGTRELVFADLPYIVVYRITDAVDILAVVHAARKWPMSFS